jgi:bifunctional non-homologous end joining protein LigD
MKTEQLPSVELGYREGSSDKVYRACVEADGTGFVVNFAYGRRGSSLAAGTKTQGPVTLDEATVIYEKLIRSKLAKGYKPTGTASTGIGMNVAEERKDTGLRAMLLNPITEEDAERYLTDPDWCAQEKYDGKRILVRKTDTGIVAANRHGLTTGFPTVLAEQLVRVPGDFVIDGELVGDRYYAFDLLENVEDDWRAMPYWHRLDVLRHQFGELSGGVIVAETAIREEKQVMLEQLRAAGKEGIVFKHVRAGWQPGRQASGGSALKCKFWASCSCVVARINGKRSVEVALGGVPVGNVTIPPNQAIPAVGQVVEVRYLYVQGVGGSLYQPIYLGVRNDVPAADCTV